MSASDHASDTRIAPLQAEVADRFGILPNFFRLAPETPEITTNLWQFARFGYLDNPLPSLFKERLFVYLSRFCEVRYCIARHIGFLTGLGRPAGDRECAPETVEQVLRLIRRPLPRGEALEPYLAVLTADPASLPCPPPSDTPAEEAVFACATHVFLQTPQALRCLQALRQTFGEPLFQHLTVLLAFIRTAHFWTKVHPEIVFEDDVKELLATHEALAGCVLNDPEAATSEVDQVLLDELTTLRRERALRADLERANQALRATEERLREQDRRKDEFLATLAHELRNPLAPIRFGLQVLKHAPADKTAADTRAMLERQIERMVRLVDDLLDVNRISLGKIELRKERVELAAVVQDAVEAVRPLCTDMNHELTLTLPPQPVWLYADPARLAQSIGNLLTNACKFTDHGGRIDLRVELADLEPERPQAVIRVRDTGIGIAADQLDGIFELFTQVDMSLERSHSGLGVGLALVKRLIEMHDGTVAARSPGPAQGSEFIVQLPVLSPQPAAPAQQQQQPAGRAATPVRRILVVDDNHDSADALAMLLRLSGHEVVTAYDGSEALTTAAQRQPDVILLDIGLPGLNGYDVAQRIRRQRGNDVVLVALTGWGQEEDRRLSAQAGFDAHLVKPVDYAGLTSLLAGLSAG